MSTSCCRDQSGDDEDHGHGTVNYDYENNGENGENNDDKKPS
jgi:hypothetical protein